MVEQDIITTLIKGHDSVNRQFVGRVDNVSTRRTAIENISFVDGATVATSKVVSTSFIIPDHPTYGIINDGVLKIIGDSVDPYTSTTVIRVVNPSKLFKERFSHEDFNDTVTTTATWSTSTGTLTFSTVALTFPITFPGTF